MCNRFFRVLLIGLSVLFVEQKGQGGIQTSKEYVLAAIADLKDYWRYYKQSAVTGCMLAGSSILYRRPKVCLAGYGLTGIYATFMWYKGMREVNNIKKKYAPILKPENNWNQNQKKETSWIFARWRQFDVYGDALYWPTAACTKHYQQLIVETLLRDIYNRRIIIKINGKIVDFPSPEQVAYAIHQEIDMLKADKEILKKYTNIYRKICSDDGFVPENSWMRIFWPNYNRASRLYIEIVSMIERLEALQDIIALLRINGGGNHWPSLVYARQ